MGMSRVVGGLMQHFERVYVDFAVGLVLKSGLTVFGVLLIML